MSRYIVPLLFGLIGAAILVSLGTWQVRRLEWKQDILAQIEARIHGDPRPLPAPDAADPERDKYQPVALSGEIAEGEIHVLVSVKQVGAGYRIIAPYVTTDGRRLLLDRGFVLADSKAAQRQVGPTEVLGNLHWPDDRSSSTPENDMTANIWFARDIADMAQSLNTEPMLVIARSVSPMPEGVTPLPVATAGIPNDHLQYAITWFSLAVIWLLMTGAFVWRMRQTKEGARP